MIKHIFLDMDNTLLQSDGSISSETRTFLNGLDIPITLVSARAPLEMQFAIEELNLVDEQFSFNGGLIYKPSPNNQMEEIKSIPLETSDAVRIIKLVREEFPSASLCWYTKNEWFAEKIDRGIEYETSITHQTPTLVNFDDFNTENAEMFKIMLISFDAEVREKMVDAINALNIANIATKSTGIEYYEITNAKAIKRNAIEYLKQRDQLKTDELAAFGDGENDIEMFKVVGHPIAMGNATDEVKGYAEFVTDSNNANGIISGIQRLMQSK